MRVLLLCLIMSFGLSAPVLAESSAYIQALERLHKFNRYRPEQSAKHVPSKDILAGRILDRTNRVIGEVRDVILDRNGNIAMLNVDFNRMNLGVESLVINYNQMGTRPATNGYKIGRTDDQIAGMLPDLLAATETASGNNAQIFSLRKIVGKKIYNHKGKKLGKIERVLFDSTGARAELLFIKMDQKSIRGKKMAIPFTSASYKKNKISVKKDFASAMVSYAKGK